MNTSQENQNRTNIAQRCMISLVQDELNWVEILVSSLEDALAFWDQLLTEAGYVGCGSWDHGRSYSCGTNRVLILEVDQGTWSADDDRASRWQRRMMDFKDVTTRLREAGL
jgi:hypothetical protein